MFELQVVAALVVVLVLFVIVVVVTPRGLLAIVARAPRSSPSSCSHRCSGQVRHNRKG